MKSPENNRLLLAVLLLIMVLWIAGCATTAADRNNDGDGFPRGSVAIKGRLG